MTATALSNVAAWWESCVSNEDCRYRMLVFGPFVQHEVLFWGYCGVLLFLEFFAFHLVAKYKIQQLRITPAEVVKCVKLVLFNQLVVSFGLNLALSTLAFKVYTYERMSLKYFPSWNIVLANLVGFILIEEVLFYYSHRALHYGPIYPYIHKIHHQFKAPFGPAAEYAHPIELIFSNILPLMAGPLILRPHVLVSWLWYGIGIIGTISHHSGYKFPFLVGGLDPLFHDYHHYSFVCNFGLLGIFDWLHGTDKGFHEYRSTSKQKKM